MTQPTIKTLSYSTSRNIGDHIQSMAIEQHIPHRDGHIDRDFLHEYAGDRVVVPMNGWFMRLPQNWPPSDNIASVFIGFHITTWTDAETHLCSPASVNYLRKHAPIGCRDEYTCEVLTRHGVNAYFTGCPTMTFPRRPNPANGKTALVDANSLNVPRAIKKSAIRISQIAPEYTSETTRRRLAEDVMAYYQKNVSRVITTRIHCAIPCAAMGIPVVFFGDPTDERLTALTHIGLKIHDIRRHMRPAGLFSRAAQKAISRDFSDVDWAPEPVEFEDKKSAMVEHIMSALALYVRPSDAHG